VIAEIVKLPPAPDISDDIYDEDDDHNSFLELGGTEGKLPISLK
jgi:hypothetical protein